jgi:hypothetical protein
MVAPSYYLAVDCNNLNGDSPFEKGAALMRHTLFSALPVINRRQLGQMHMCNGLT